MGIKKAMPRFNTMWYAVEPYSSLYVQSDTSKYIHIKLRNGMSVTIIRFLMDGRMIVVCIFSSPLFVLFLFIYLMKSYHNYYKKALESAKYLKDDFKVALIYFEFAQNYYDKGDDKKALVNFFNAKEILKKTSDTENLARVETRIKDIKLRLDKMSFDMIAEKYE